MTSYFDVQLSCKCEYEDPSSSKLPQLFTASILVFLGHALSSVVHHGLSFRKQRSMRKFSCRWCDHILSIFILVIMHNIRSPRTYTNMTKKPVTWRFTCFIAVCKSPDFGSTAQESLTWELSKPQKNCRVPNNPEFEPIIRLMRGSRT